MSTFWVHYNTCPLSPDFLSSESISFSTGVSSSISFITGHLHFFIDCNKNSFQGFSFWKLWYLKDMLGYWQETGGSLLMARFMTIAEQRHKVPKLPKRVFSVFVLNISVNWLLSYRVTTRDSLSKLSSPLAVLRFLRFEFYSSSLATRPNGNQRSTAKGKVKVNRPLIQRVSALNNQ